MEGISDIKIIGIDEKRPPVIRKEPYIDIFFKLSHQAPTDWCKDFNSLLTGHASSPHIDEKNGRFIESWVRTPDEVMPLLVLLKQTITDCTCQYIARIEDSARHSASRDMFANEDTGEQGRLNRIIANLDFGENSQ